MEKQSGQMYVTYLTCSYLLHTAPTVGHHRVTEYQAKQISGLTSCRYSQVLTFFHLLPSFISTSLSLTPNIVFKSVFYKNVIVLQVQSVARLNNEISSRALGSSTIRDILQPTGYLPSIPVWCQVQDKHRLGFLQKVTKPCCICISQ